MISFIVSLIIGGVAGWLAGLIMKAKHGTIVTILLGVVGGLIGGWLLGILGVHFTGLVGNIICAVIGACLLIFLGRVIAKK